MLPRNTLNKRSIITALVVGCGGGVLMLGMLGCQDGPLYAMKHANPYFTRQWSRDEEIGVTDHTRREVLISLAETIDSLPAERQAFWSQHLDQIFQNDGSAEMRRLAVLAAGKSVDPGGISIIESGLDDENIKVRMEACRALGNRSEDQSASLLAATLGKTQNKDVRHAAIAALAKHPGEIANNALKLALQDYDPATQDLAIASLRESTGQDYGADPGVWIAALNGDPPEQPPVSSGLPSLF